MKLKYICSVCGKESFNQDEIVACEFEHYSHPKEFNIGDYVTVLLKESDPNLIYIVEREWFNCDLDQVVYDVYAEDIDYHTGLTADKLVLVSPSLGEKKNTYPERFREYIKNKIGIMPTISIDDYGYIDYSFHAESIVKFMIKNDIEQQQ